RAQAPTRVVEQDAPHDLRGNGKKMGAVLPVDAPLIDQLQIGFVDEDGRLNGAVAPLARGAARRDDAQLVVDERNETIEGLTVPALPVAKQTCDVGHRFRRIWTDARAPLLHAAPSPSRRSRRRARTNL